MEKERNTLHEENAKLLDLPNPDGPALQQLSSPLATARLIEDIAVVSYPEGIKGPNPALNVNPRRGQFR